ncbi:MAG TPA: capsule biosynthesis protein CapB, partial [Pseudomonadota bacterium]|nr:capsule biosynthesis protein CapB [Pseudomonadota bacterium]
MRQHFVVLLGRREQDAAAFTLLAEQVRCGEPSEHVRLAWPAALRATGGGGAAALLEELAGAGSAAAADKSPRVRAAAVIALAELLRRGQADTTAVLTALLADPEPLVYQIVIEEIEALALQQKLTAGAATALDAALARRAAALPAKLTEPTMRAREALASLSPPLAAARQELAPKLKALPLGASLSLSTQVAPLDFGRLLSQLAGDGFGYYAQPIAGGYRVERGARFVRRAWRLLHELRMHSPYKRQDALHSIGREFYGQLRAPAGLLAEATNTAVPGEPLASPSDGTWGAQLPTVDDILSMPLLGAEPVLIFSSRGLTELTPPRSAPARLRARLSVTARYAELAELRLRSLDPLDPSDKTRYAEALAALGFTLVQRPYSELTLQSDVPVLPPAPGRGSDAAPLAPGALALLVSPGDFAGLTHYLTSPSENTFGQLGFAVMVVGALMLASNLRQRARISRDRAAIPLCIGGWGTRGKSGTERLKAAMMHGLDVNVLTKTTGCEAMFIHGIPGRKPTEIFIHRSYDKATIWEQRDLLALAARLHADVFLWECMALSGPLVSVLSEEWMRDDLQTLTNAYPDHEDIQGPAGHDVARSIAGFMRSGGTVITSEEQMLPVLADEARRKRARLITLAARDHLLLADDLLARFPYREHPRNVALVRRLAVELGLDPDLATADMADHVVPDLGVLKVYPTVTHRGRRLTFINGMSANDRTGFLSNWHRTGCERPIEQPGRWVVTVVNNRYDRVARSKAFAEIIVRDASAERHILIGTNLAGLRVYVAQALVHLLRELHLFRSDDAPESVPELLRARGERLRHRLR